METNERPRANSLLTRPQKGFDRGQKDEKSNLNRRGTCAICIRPLSKNIAYKILKYKDRGDNREIDFGWEERRSLWRFASIGLGFARRPFGADTADSNRKDKKAKKCMRRGRHLARCGHKFVRRRYVVPSPLSVRSGGGSVSFSSGLLA